MDDFKRRTFVKLSALGFANIALNIQALSSYAQKANAHFGKWNSETELNWDALLEEISKLASLQHQLPWDQKHYTSQVKNLLLQCKFPQFENIKTELDNYENKRPSWFESANLHYEADFQISLYQFEKEEYIPHHDHPQMTGVLNVLSGRILAKNYDISEQLSSSTKTNKNGITTTTHRCLLKQSEEEIITTGEVGILTANEGNIHSIMPQEFTQMIDVFTPAYKHDTNAKWYTVNEEENYEGRANIFEAEYEVSGQTK